MTMEQISFKKEGKYQQAKKNIGEPPSYLIAQVCQI